MLDFSGSLTNGEFYKYVDMFKNNVLKNMTARDIITLVPIDKAIETKFEIIGRCDFRKIKASLNDSLGRYELLKADEKIVQMWNIMTDTLFQNQIDRVRNARSKFNSLTDIIGAINHSAPYLKNADNHKVLFIFSDMIQESSDVNFKKLKSFDQIELELKDLDSKGLIPDMRSVSVFICGATADENSRYRLYKKFWQAFFSKSGAKLYDYGYGIHDRIESFLSEIRRIQDN